MKTSSILLYRGIKKLRNKLESLVYHVLFGDCGMADAFFSHTKLIPHVAVYLQEKEPTYSAARHIIATYKVCDAFLTLCDSFLTTFWWLSFELANQSAKICKRLSRQFRVRSPTTVNSASLTSCNLIGQLKRKSSDSCQRDVKKLIKNFAKWKWFDAHGLAALPPQASTRPLKPIGCLLENSLDFLVCFVTN